MSAITLRDIASVLEQKAPLAWQESYDNSGLLLGNPNDAVEGILCTLDVTEQVLEEALQKNCNLIVAHHPIIFSALKKINGKNSVERILLKAIKAGIAVYAAHTNLDNYRKGVNHLICEKLGLKHTSILAPATGKLQKLVVYVPDAHAQPLGDALFAAGAGHIGNYNECSFQVHGTGTFRPMEGSRPFLGEQGKRHSEMESQMEFLVPQHLTQVVLAAMKQAHPYEEVAYDLIPLNNTDRYTGAGMTGSWEQPLSLEELLDRVARTFACKTLRHTASVTDAYSRVAVCGGSGSFLLKDAIAAGAQVFVTADYKYHQFFDADNQILIIDIGHYESEQYTPALLKEMIVEKFPTFAVHLSETNTNPIHYYIP
jgi:dinuclear metal center YbgI/SA1388 family protein